MRNRTSWHFLLCLLNCLMHFHLLYLPSKKRMISGKKYLTSYLYYLYSYTKYFKKVKIHYKCYCMLKYKFDIQASGPLIFIYLCLYIFIDIFIDFDFDLLIFNALKYFFLICSGTYFVEFEIIGHNWRKFLILQHMYEILIYTLNVFPSFSR
jgi:hypothetical protein